MIAKVSRREVKKYFLLANAGKEFFKKGTHFGIDELQDKYHAKLKEFIDMEEKALDERIRDKIRLGRYNEMDWHTGNVKLKEMGSWPEMKGLPIEFTTGNIPDVARLIGKFKNGTMSGYGPEKLEKISRCVERLDSIGRNVNFVRPNFPLILFQGGEIREEHNDWARENYRLLCNIFRYDIDDGSERAVSYSLAGLEDAPVYFGQRA